ncbi:MAG: Enoyl-[acyl-carrier-protein] reductase [NADH] FabI [Alphaproteobacteria bacterium MarineAlpha5_Bin12]|nr:enoyl-[acyl-carrier-protein] reductase FabI [Pelagibacteraceae bacterium]PPR41179.1 MAG: Enoyl-[acyl-carrier-protein] reductase [NADH] FabI [Alphaproteobacteria bacterium MarineAlpha5_Bin12]|tara:strand:+ start:6920 stop:7696 length:777 start_codon:yes stop_codon:yes gene_type:complete
MLQNKKGLVFGIANDHSIAWGIAKSLSDQGAELALTYQNEILYKRIEPLAKTINTKLLLPCDVTKIEEVDECFNKILKTWGKIDFVIHAIAYSNKEELAGRYIDTSLENFNKTLNISCFSLTQIAKRSISLMKEGGSIVTLSFYGGEKVIPNYNVMGVAKAALETSVKYLSIDLGTKKIRINAISAGPMRTLSGAAIKNSREIFNFTKNNSPLNRNADLSEIGNSAVYLVSDLSSAVTGEVLYVDCGYNIIGIPKKNI